MDDAKKITQGIIKYLEGSKKLYLLPSIIGELKKESKTERATVESAVELLDEEKNEIEEILSEKFGSTNDINFVVNPKLLGGLKINVNGLELDLSVVGEIERKYEN